MLEQQLGWIGVLIEPDPHMYSLLVGNRKTSTVNVHGLVCQVKG